MEEGAILPCGDTVYMALAFYVSVGVLTLRAAVLAANLRLSLGEREGYVFEGDGFGQC